jgi:hypothetical protein
MASSQHVYEIRPRKDKRGVNLISDVLCGGSQIVAELKEFPVRRTKTSPLPIR